MGWFGKKHCIYMMHPDARNCCAASVKYCSENFSYELSFVIYLVLLPVIKRTSYFIVMIYLYIQI